jgi:hypothetical protein
MLPGSAATVACPHAVACRPRRATPPCRGRPPIPGLTPATFFGRASAPPGGRGDDRRHFCSRQAQYADHGIATFPLRGDKRPAIRGYNRVGLRGSRELARKFADATAFGFMTNERTRITGIDTQTTMTRRRRQPHAFIAALVCVTGPLMVAEIVLFRFYAGFRAV